MEISVRSATEKDLGDCLAVEKAAMKDYCYLDDVWDYFNTTKGELNCAIVDQKIVGIGKFTVLYDGSGWLETLRVDPEYQGQGVGKAIYKEYAKQAKKYNCPSMAMYTGLKNAVSAGLAEKNGLTKAGQFRGYNLTNFNASKEAYNFKHTSTKRAVQLIMPHKDEYNGYMVFNRTFYRINEKTIRGLAIEGKVFEDTLNNSFIVCGSRFQHDLSLHIAIMVGDYDKCLAFAKNYAVAQGINKITFTIPLENPEIEEFLKTNKFEKESSDTITKEIVF